MADNDDHDEFVVVDQDSPRRESLGKHLSPLPPTSQTPVSTRRLTRRSGAHNDTLDPLRALPQVRAIPWYEGRELSIEKSTGSSRVQTRGACLLASRGAVQLPGCTHCQGGLGRFSECIALDDWFSGACATCQLATRGNLCSLRKDKRASVASETEQQAQVSSSIEMVSTREASRKTHPGSSSTPSEPIRGSSVRSESVVASTSSVSRPTSNSSSVHPQDSKASDNEFVPQLARPQATKRKREFLQETSVHRPYVSPYAPLDPPNRFAYGLPNTPTLHSRPNAIVPADMSREQVVHTNYIRERDPQHNVMAHHQPVIIAPKPGFVPINGTANKNSSIIQPSPKTKSGREEEYDRDRTESLSPSTQLLDHHAKPPLPEPASTRKRKPLPDPTRMSTRNTQKKTPRVNSASAQPNSLGAIDLPASPSINNLPRRKQNKILELIGGLQSGIKNCQQQAESMQKQLDLLQAALGLGANDDRNGS